MEGLVRVNQDILKRNPQIPPLYDSGVRYEAENGTEDWRTIVDIRDNLNGEGNPVGDCEDLAAWRAAELRERDNEPGAFVDVVRGGLGLWHAVVRRANGKLEDPSKRLGMNPRPLAGTEAEAEPMAGSLTWKVERIPGGWRGSLTLPDIRFGRDADGMIRVSVSGSTRAEAMQRAAALAGLSVSHKALAGILGNRRLSNIRNVGRIAGLAMREPRTLGKAAPKLSPGMAKLAAGLCR